MKKTSQIKIQEIKKAVRDFRSNRNKELNAFIDKNVFWIIAFCDSEWNKKFHEHAGADANIDDYQAFDSMGGVIKTDKVDEYNAIAERYKNANRMFMKDKDNAFKMFFYEMNNHEYIYDADDETVLKACGIDEQFLDDNDLRQTYTKARKYYWNIAKCYA